MMRVDACIHTASSKRRIEIRDGVYHIYTNAKPVQGKANAEAIKLIADYLDVAKSNVSIRKGEKSRNKVFEIKRGP